MEEVLRTILANLVENQKAVSIDHTEKDGTDFYYVKVAQDEEGKVAKAIKALCKALGAKEGRKVEVVFPFKHKKSEID